MDAKEAAKQIEAALTMSREERAAEVVKRIGPQAAVVAATWLAFETHALIRRRGEGPATRELVALAEALEDAAINAGAHFTPLTGLGVPRA